MKIDDPHIVETTSPEDTLDFGARLGAALVPGAVLALVGDLGAGKTHLVKGVARGCEVPAEVVVNSPTYVLINEYPGRVYLYHIDAYRMNGPDELDSLGFDEMVDQSAAVIIEWADRVLDTLPDDRLRVEIEPTGEQTRRFHLEAGGAISSMVLSTLRENMPRPA